MRILALLTIIVIGTGCAQFQGPGKLRVPKYRGGTTPQVAPADEESEEGVDPEAYLPSSRGSKKGYRPRREFSLNWPLNVVKINQPFRPQKKRRPHLGVDFAGTKGTPIFAAHEGLVIYAGRAFRGFGKMVIVEYDGQWASLYAHLDKIGVRQGQIVEQGQTVGTMGRTGRATGVHLHFELLHSQRPVDPIPLLNEFNRLVNTDKDSVRRPAGY